MQKLFTMMVIMVTALAVSSTAYGDGLKCEATPSRAQEIPAPMGGTLTGGELELEFDEGLTQVEVKKFRVEGDSGNVTKAHLHCQLPGVAGPVAFGFLVPGNCAFDPAAGEFDCPPLTNDDFTGNDCVPEIDRPVNNIAALFFAAREGLIYVNVHTTDNPPGEVRGQLLCEDLIS